MPKVKIVTAESQRREIIKIGDRIADLVKKAQPLIRYKKTVDARYDRAWKERNASNIRIYAGILRRVMKKLTPLNGQISALEKRCRHMQRELTRN